jgi:hypothetical protein
VDTHGQEDGGTLGSGREEGRAAREEVVRTRVGGEQLLEVGWGGKTGLWLGSIPCTILGKHHTPRMGGNLSLYKSDMAWSTGNTIQHHIQHYLSDTIASIYGSLATLRRSDALSGSSEREQYFANLKEVIADC